MPKWTFLPVVEKSKRSDYYHQRWMRTRNMKKFARATGMTFMEAQEYIDDKLQIWYHYTGLSENIQYKIDVRTKRRFKVWRTGQ
jgi:hypothetical protein